MKVSILIPCYNSELYLEKTINSAINQTWTNKEIIIVDDGSTDMSLTTALKYQEKGLVKVYNQNNKGACAARNLAFAKSSGEYIQYLDADDLLSPDKIESQIRELEKYNDLNIIAFSKWSRFYDEMKLDLPANNIHLNKDWDIPLDLLNAYFKGEGMGQTSIWLTPRIIIERSKGWREDININQDGEFFTRMLLEAKKIVFSETGHVYYRSNVKGSITNQTKNIELINSRFDSIRYIKLAVLQKSADLDTKKALGILFQTFIYESPNISRNTLEQAYNEIIQLNLVNFQFVGGRKFKFITSLLGFKIAISLRNYLQRIK